MLQDALEERLRAVWSVSRYLGGMAVLKRFLRPWLHKGTMTLLDAAAGTGDVALGLHLWAARRGTALRLALLDHRPEVLAIARERTGGVPGVALVPGDARRLPFPDRQFDLAVCTLALHQFSPAEVALVLRELDRVSRRGWVIADLERHPLTCGAVRLLAGSVRQSPIPRYDGPLAVVRGCRATEVQKLVQAVGVKAAVYRCFPSWLAIVAQRG